MLGISCNFEAKIHRFGLNRDISMLLKEVPGLKAEKKKLLDSVKRAHNSHAQLFHGSAGTASYLLALAYAQYLACLEPNDEDSCGNCKHCKQFQKYSYPDLHFSFPFARVAGAPKELNCDYFIKDWIQFITNKPLFNLNDWLYQLDVANKQAQINVDEASRIINKLSLKSYSGGPKFIILYLPEYLHPSAANKLLKTLEEPTDDSIIILISENAERILQTITSRCQKLYIPRANRSDIQEYLLGQGISSSDAERAAAVAENDMVQALKISSHSDRFLKYGELFQNWMRGCYSAKVKEIFTFVDEFCGYDKESQKEALKFFIQTLELAFVAQKKGKPISHPIYQELSFKLDGFASVLHLKNTQLALEVLEKAIHDLKRNGNAKLILSDASFQFSNLLRLKES